MKFYVIPGVIGEKELADLMSAKCANHSEVRGNTVFLCYQAKEHLFPEPTIGWMPTDETEGHDFTAKDSEHWFAKSGYTRIESRLELAKFLIPQMCKGHVVVGNNTVVNTKGESYTLSVMEKDGGVDLKYQAWGAIVESYKGLVYFGPGAEKVVSRIPKKRNQSMITLKGLINKDR